MTESQTITVLDKHQETSSNYSRAGEIISFELEVAGKTVPFDIDVAAEKATLADIVPPARKLSSKLAIAVREGVEEKGQSVPCGKGCCACCNSLTPLSAPEVFRMREELLVLPTETSNRILKSCIHTAERILEKMGRIDCLLKDFSKNGKPRISQINKWYGELKLTCPFLSESLCMLYEQRPLACREHIVTGSSGPCQKDRKCRPNVVPMPVSILEALGQLAGELEQTDVEAVMLPFSFSWAQDNLQRAERVWPAVEMVRRFVEILKQKASKNSKAVACRSENLSRRFSHLRPHKSYPLSALLL